MAKHPWYHNQRNVAFVIIVVFVVLLVTGITALGLSPDLKTFIYRPISVRPPINAPTTTSGCVISGQALLDDFYHKGSFAQVNSQDGVITVKNNRTDCTESFVAWNRVATGGPIIFNQNAAIGQVVAFQVPPNTTKTIVISLPQGCNSQKTLTAGPLIKPITNQINFATNPVIASVDINTAGKWCPTAASPYVGHVSSFSVSQSNRDEIIDTGTVMYAYGIAPSESGARQNALDALDTECLATNTQNLYQIFRGSFIGQTGVDPDPIVARWFKIPAGTPFYGFCPPSSLACTLEPGTSAVKYSGPLGTIPINGKQYPIWGAVSSGVCDTINSLSSQ